MDNNPLTLSQVDNTFSLSHLGFAVLAMEQMYPYPSLPLRQIRILIPVCHIDCMWLKVVTPHLYL